MSNSQKSKIHLLNLIFSKFFPPSQLEVPLTYFEDLIVAHKVYSSVSKLRSVLRSIDDDIISELIPQLDFDTMPSGGKKWVVVPPDK